MKTSRPSTALKITSWNGDPLEGAVAPGSPLKELSSVYRAPQALARGGAVHQVRIMFIQCCDWYGGRCQPFASCQWTSGLQKLHLDIL